MPKQGPAFEASQTPKQYKNSNVLPVFKQELRDKLRESLKVNFEFSAKELSSRGLHQASKWVTELLDKLHSTSKHNCLQALGPVSIASEGNPKYDNMHFDFFAYDTYEGEDSLAEFRFNNNKNSLDSNTYAYCRAKALFDMREFAKAREYLSQRDLKSSPLLTFMKFYSEILDGELKSHNPNKDIMARLKDSAPATNSAYANIWDELYPVYLKNSETILPDSNSMNVTGQDPFCLYLLGISASKTKRSKVAKEILIKSISTFPYNWLAWVELGQTLTSLGECIYTIKQLPKTVMSEFFYIYMNSTFRFSEQEIKLKIALLEDLFPNSQIVGLTKALLLYDHEDFGSACPLFEKIFKDDATLLDYANNYSYTLYLKKESTKLMGFAERCVHLDMLRPETCCVVGDSYALRNNHEKAIEYYCKALQLNESFVYAWLRAGNEFIQLKNFSAAIDSFTKVTVLKPRESRALNSLAAIYELLDMPTQAILYYKESVAVNPGNYRSWHSLGELYQKSQRLELALKCYENCTGNYKSAPAVHLNIGDLLRTLSKSPCFDSQEWLKAAYHYRLGLDSVPVNQPCTQQVSKALYFLAEFEIYRGELENALTYCNRAMDHSAFDHKKGKSIKEKIELKVVELAQLSHS